MNISKCFKFQKSTVKYTFQLHTIYFHPFLWRLLMKEEKKKKGDHIGQGYMKLCVNNNDDIVILNDLELDDNHGKLDIVMSLSVSSLYSWFNGSSDLNGVQIVLETHTMKFKTARFSHPFQTSQILRNWAWLFQADQLNLEIQELRGISRILQQLYGKAKWKCPYLPYMNKKKKQEN